MQAMKYHELIDSVRNVGKDPSRLIFEDELTGIHNRRFLLGFLNDKVRWGTGEDYPLSLLVLDVDHFKQINDTHGHDAGDQALIWLAHLLAEMSGDDAIPIRYAGDEFVVLLPHTHSSDAGNVAQRILHQTKLRTLKLKDGGVNVPVSVSIGVATAPEDAGNGRQLMLRADSALYHAKRAGRNQAVSAGQIDPATVFPNAALQQIASLGVAGRERDLRLVSKALDSLNLGRSQFLLFEGAPGMGKSTLLETIRANPAGAQSMRLVKVTGIQQEAYRPYYLAASIILSLIGQRGEEGTELFQSLSRRQMRELSRILPQLADLAVAEAEEKEDEASGREGIFRAAAELLAEAVDPALVILIDDLHFADEATLMLLRVLMQREQLPLLVIGAAIDTFRLDGEEESSPLERFYALHHESLHIERVKLSPLTAADIEAHVQSIFPRLKSSTDLANELAHITQGNPLFVSEVLRKLVLDQKITPKGQGWMIEKLEESYLPRSLEEIVLQKISALDEESRQLLAQASTFGEDVSLSYLTASSEQEESRVLEFLDRAEALGLVRLDFQINDETMRFLSKRVLEIAYGSLNQEQRQELHERVGNYQEHLSEQRLFTSASLLAYHFKRSANRVKAQRYEKVQLAHDRAVFVAQEAQRYVGDGYFEFTGPLHPSSLALVAAFLRAFLTAVRGIQLYPPGSGPIRAAQGQAHAAIDVLLSMNEALSLSPAEGGLRVNGAELATREFRALEDSVRELFARADLQSVTFRRGLSEEEMNCLLEALGEIKTDPVARGYWREFAAERRLEHIGFRQVRYSRLKSKTVTPTPIASSEVELTPAELADIPDLLRFFLGAAKNIKLYPTGSRPLTSFVRHFHESLERILSRRQVITLAAVNDSLLVNGVKLSAPELEVVVEGFVAFMNSVALDSLSFRAHVTAAEIEALLGSLRELPTSGVDEHYWEDVSRQHRLSGLAFNTERYALGALQGTKRIEPLSDLPKDAAPEPVVLDEMVFEEAYVTDDVPEEAAHSQEGEPITEESFESLVRVFSTHGRELLLRGERDAFEQMIRTLFGDFQKNEPQLRQRILVGCRSLLDGLMLPLQLQFASVTVDALGSVLREERDPRLLGEVGAILQKLSNGAIQFADYQLACRIFCELRDRSRSSTERDPTADSLEPKLESAIQKLLEEDMLSGDLARQRKAAQVLVSIGSAGIPLLIDIIKGQRDYRIRQLAARLLAELGPEAARRLKHEILFEVTVVQRTRILEVIDNVTGDVRDELTYCLGDADPKLRRAAFQLADRLKDESLIEVLAPFARSDDLAVAKGAISSMAKFRSANAVDALVSILSSAKQPEVAIACCQALAQIGDPSCLEALVQILGQKKRQLFGRVWGEQVRATAALAVGQINHPRVARILADYVEDSDPRVSQLARSALTRIRGEAGGRRERRATEGVGKPGVSDPTEEPA